jgi:diguanylate cyclase (GGDEF)-like protein/PAS domain S-box-containing protein
LFSLLLDYHLYKLTAFSWPPLVVAILVAILGTVVLLRDRLTAVNTTFYLLTQAAALWLLGISSVFSTTDYPTAMAWSRIEHLGVVFLPTLVYAFAASIVKNDRPARRWLIAASLLSCCFYAFCLRSSVFLAGLWTYRWGFYPRYGALSYPFLSFFAIALFTAMRLLALEYRDALPGSRHKRLQLLMIALALGYGGAIDFLPAFGIDVYPAGPWFVLAFLIASAVAVARYRLIDITPGMIAPEVLNTIPTAVLALDAELRVSLANRAACVMFRKSLRELMVARAVEILPGFFTPQNLEKIQASGLQEPVEFIQGIQGENRVWEIVSVSVLRTPRGEIQAYVCVLQDKTELKNKSEEVRYYSNIVGSTIAQSQQSEQARQESENRYQLLINAVQDYAIIMLDPDGYVTSWNRGAERIKGYRADEIMGKHFSLFYPLEDVRGGKPESLMKTALEKGQVRDTGWRIRKDGSRFWADILLTAIWDTSGRLRGFAKITRDVTEQMRLRTLSYRDELTGLYNRRGFFNLAEQVVQQARRDKQSPVVYLVDLDGLKPINDTYGHAEGDVALKRVANVLKRTFRQSDVVARIGGDEFAILTLEDADAKDDPLSRLHDHLKDEAKTSGENRYPLSASCGSAHLEPFGPVRIEEALARADQMLYDEKRRKKIRTPPNANAA